MLFVAGGLEGIGRQIINDTMLRYGIGGVMLVGWLAYFSLAGAGRSTAPEVAR
jgi:hypothetical protein